jgi:hypothetical protein
MDAGPRRRARCRRSRSDADRRINLFNDDKDTDDFIAEGKDWSAYYGQPIRMVVIDTFNKAITGANEISGQDMTKVLSRLERISVRSTAPWCPRSTNPRKARCAATPRSRATCPT